MAHILNTGRQWKEYYYAKHLTLGEKLVQGHSLPMAALTPLSLRYTASRDTLLQSFKMPYNNWELFKQQYLTF